MVSDAPRPRVVTSLVSWATPWKPATITMSPRSRAEVIRPGVMSMIRALPWVPVVMMPACEPVSDRACMPWSWMAMASRAALIRSPAVSSMSSSRGGGSGETCSARSISSSVVSPIAEMTTTTSWPCALVATMRLATRLMLFASATDEPPYFCTTRPTPSPGACSPTLFLSGLHLSLRRGDPVVNRSGSSTGPVKYWVRGRAGADADRGRGAQQGRGTAQRPHG